MAKDIIISEKPPVQEFTKSEVITNHRYLNSTLELMKDFLKKVSTVGGAVYILRTHFGPDYDLFIRQAIREVFTGVSYAEIDNYLWRLDNPPEVG